MQHLTSTFTGCDNLPLFCQSWLPNDVPKAEIALVHGLGDHSTRYNNVLQQLVPQGYAFYSYDQRGHGQSPGKLGHIESWAEYRKDLQRFMAYVKATARTDTLFLYGHSMGGLVTLDYVLHYPEGLDGVIASGSALAMAETSKALVSVMRLLNRFASGLQIGSRLNASGISRDPAAVQAYLDDPLVHSKLTPRWFAEFLATMNWVHEHASELTLPLLMFHGEADKIVPIDGTQRFFTQVSSVDKKLITYPDTFHEPHNDLNHTDVTCDVLGWLEAHTPKVKPQ